MRLVCGAWLGSDFMTTAKTECHCPRCGRLKLKRDGSPHKCVPTVAVVLADNKGHTIAFDPKTTIAELAKAGWKMHLAMVSDPLPDGVFRSVPNIKVSNGRKVAPNPNPARSAVGSHALFVDF